MTTPQTHLLLDALNRIVKIATDSKRMTEGMDIADIQSIAQQAIEAVASEGDMPRPGSDAVEAAAISLHDAGPYGNNKYGNWAVQSSEYQQDMRERVRVILRAMGMPMQGALNREKHSFWCEECRSHTLHTDNQAGMLICDGCGAGHVDDELFPTVPLPESVGLVDTANRVMWRKGKLPHLAPVYSAAQLNAYGNDKAYATVEAINRKNSSSAGGELDRKV